VWVIGPGEDDWDPYGAKLAVDVTRAVLRHRAHAVTATMWFVDLHRVALADNPYNAGPKPEFTEPLVPEA
jgi:hypothetical protein